MIARGLVRAVIVGLVAFDPPTLAQYVPSSPAREPRGAASAGLIGLPAGRVSLRDALALLGAAARVPVHANWADDGHPDALRPEMMINIPGAPANPIRVLEALLRQCDPAIGGGATWQRSDDGGFEVGTRASLNERPVLRIYHVRDLCMALPDFAPGASLDLQAALQGRAGGAQVLRDPAEDDRLGTDSRPDREDELVDLITSTLEPGQWADQGGSSTIRRYRGLLVVSAPGYIHRQVN